MLYTLILLYLFHSTPAAPSIVPIIPAQSNQIRVFCFSDKSHQVTFHPNNKCQSSCGVYDSQNSCCKMWTITEDTVVQCDQYKNGVATGKSVELTATVLHPESNIQIVSQQNRSILTCVDESPTNIQLSHPENSNFHVKYAYLYGGYPKKFNTFSAMTTVELPANEAPKSCNRTQYRFQHNNTEILDSLSELEEKLENNSEQLEYVHRDIMLKWRACVCVGILICLFLALLFMVRYCRKHRDKFTEEKLEKYPRWVSSISIFLANFVNGGYNQVPDLEEGNTHDDKGADIDNSCDVKKDDFQKNDGDDSGCASIEQGPGVACVELSVIQENVTDEGKRDDLRGDTETKEGDEDGNEEAGGKDDDMEAIKDDEATVELGEASRPDTIEKLMRVNEQLVDKVTILLAKLEENELGQKSVSQSEEEPAEDGTLKEEHVESEDGTLDQVTSETDIKPIPAEHITEMAPPISVAPPEDPESDILADLPETSDASQPGNPPVDEAAGSQRMPATEMDKEVALENVMESLSKVKLNDTLEDVEDRPAVEEGSLSEVPKETPSQQNYAGPVHKNERLWKEGKLSRKKDVVDGKEIKNSLNSSWKDVYARVIGDNLYIYKEKKDFTAEKQLKAIILALDTCTVLEVSNNKKPNVFKFIQKNGDVFLFNAKSDSDLKEWITQINAAKADIESRDSKQRFFSKN